MNWRRANRALHRDLGYLSFGLTIVYAVSGVLVNHIHQWNPSYRIERKAAEIGPLPEGADPAAYVLGRLGETGRLKGSFRPDPDTLQIFVEGNTLTVNLATGAVQQENDRPAAITDFPVALRQEDEVPRRTAAQRGEGSLAIERARRFRPAAVRQPGRGLRCR